jgi:cellulose synthase operon protein YhjQ
MKTVTVFSMKGGTGRTTVASNLATQLVDRGYRCLLVDADPQNALGLHLGMEVGERFGLARDGLSPRDLASFNQRAGGAVPYLPFGHCSLEDLQAIERAVQQDPLLLTRRMTDLAPPDTDLVIVDAPAGQGRWTPALLRAADLVLVVLHADAVSYATLPACEELLGQRGLPGVVGYLINAMDSRRPLSGDIQASMENMLGDEMLGFTIPDDEALREAVANQLSLLEHAPDSYALRGFRELAGWIADILIDV